MKLLLQKDWPWAAKASIYKVLHNVWAVGRGAHGDMNLLGKDDDSNGR